MKQSVPSDALIVVYRAVNLINGKGYIGITSRGVRRRRIEHAYSAKRGSTAWFHAAIRKYGIEAFEFSAIEECVGAAAANETERRLIAELKPAYNGTAGGEGTLGRTPLSSDARARIGAASRARKPTLGRKATLAERARLSQLGHENKAKFAQFARLGPAARARPVVCMTDGRVFPSARAAAKTYNIPPNSITEVCQRKKYRHTSGGHVFRYAEE